MKEIILLLSSFLPQTNLFLCFNIWPFISHSDNQTLNLKPTQISVLVSPVFSLAVIGHYMDNGHLSGLFSHFVRFDKEGLKRWSKKRITFFENWTSLGEF